MMTAKGTMTDSTGHEWELTDLQLALNNAVNVAITDMKGTIVYANENFCQTTGYTLNELLGQNHRIINSGYHPPEYFQVMWASISKGKVWRGEIKNKAKDGTYYWVKTAITPFMNSQNKPQYYMSIHTDITKQKNAESKVLELNEQLEEQVAERTRHLEALNQELLNSTSKYQLQEKHLKENLLKCFQILSIDPETVVLNAAPVSQQHETLLKLSEREKGVLNLIVEGKTNKEIAESLCVTLHTAKAHVSNILQKLGLQDRTQAAVFALKSGLVQRNQ